jgi:flavin-dependent dehydrogenase
MNDNVNKIVIVGGGTAGWLTASIIAAHHNTHLKNGLEITLIESPDIKPVGVGEGTWPTMRNTLKEIGISEDDFICAAEASFKQGSQFIGWCNGQSDDNYYHPFVAPHGFGQTDIVAHWQHNNSHIPYAQSVSFQANLCDNNRAPKQTQTPEYAAVANYGYHLNAAKFSDLLKQHCIKKLGVKHIIDNVTSVNGELNEPIQSITTKKNGNFLAQLFIDCSGSQSLLLGRHYQVPFIAKDDILFNDSALAVQVGYKNDQDKIASHTLSTAQKAGWIWDIGLPTRRGVGYVYSSKYTSDTEAEKTLKLYLKENLADDNIKTTSIRKLKFTPGYRANFWHKNCVAVGMSAGFIEPLEASALAMVELSAQMIAKELPANTAIMAITADRFNQRFHYRWQRIIEFLKLHYLLSKRTDSQYWRDNKKTEKIPKRLKELLKLWKFQPPSYNDFSEIEEIFPAASYQYILYGMGFFYRTTFNIFAIQ